MKKLLLILTFFLITFTGYSQWSSAGYTYDTTFFSSTITDSSAGWSSFTAPISAVYELINLGGDTVNYKIPVTAPSNAQVGIDLPPMSTTGLIKLTIGAVIYYRERVNATYSKLTIKWQKNKP